MKRKGIISTFKRRKVSVPKSNDSGVSSEVKMQKIEKSTENKLKISINVEDNQRFITHDNFDKNDESTNGKMDFNMSSSIPVVDGYQSDKSGISFENDTESCLDYEPYQEEVESYIDYPEKLESPFECKGSQPLQALYSQSLEDGNIRSVDNCYLRYEEDKEVQNSEDITLNNYVDIKNNLRMTFCINKKSNNDTENEHINDGWNEEGKVDDESKFSGESFVQQKKGENNFVRNNSETSDTENCTGLFENATVNLNGPLNITVSRPVNSNSECFNINPKDSSINNETGPIISRSKSHLNMVNPLLPFCSADINSLKTTSYNASEISSQKAQWPREKLDSNLVIITSNDDIFNYDLMKARSLSNQSEVPSSISDLDVSSETTDKACKIRKVSDIASHADVFSKRINDCYNNTASKNSIVLQSVVVIPPSFDSNCEKRAKTSMNALKSSHNNKTTDDEQNEICSGQTPTLSSISESRSICLSSENKVFKNCLKRPRSRATRSDGPPMLCEEDALSIIGASSISGQISHISETSVCETVSKENDNEEFVNRWLRFTGETDIYGILESLCESYFTSNCENAECDKLHFVNEERIKKLSLVQLNELYAHARKKISWFEITFDIFLDCFKASAENGRICLVDMINDVFVVFNGTFIDKTSYISKIVAALQSTGFSFKETMEYIILRYGTSQISICDILLFIMSKQSRLEDHWCLVEKIICCRREKLDHDMVINLLNSFLSKYPPDLNLCTKVYDEIFKKNLVDLDKIPDFLCRSIHIAVKNSRKRKLQSFQRKFNDRSSDSSYSTSDENFRKSFARFKHEGTERYEDRFQILSFNSDASRHCNPVISKLNRSLLQMQSSQNGLYGSDENRDNNYFNSESSQVIPPLFNTPVNNYDCMEKRDCVMHNQRAISVEARPNIQSGNCRNNGNIENSELRNFSNEVNYCCNHKRNIDQDLKIPLDTTIKERPHPPILRNIRCLESRKSHLEVKNFKKRIYNDEVLNKINGTLNSYPRASTPGSSIAHPSAQPFISSSYKCNVSLHYLYPDANEKYTEITKWELLQLRDALDNMNGVKFLKLLENCYNAFTIENFILNSLILIKSSTNTDYICEKFLSLMSVLEDLDLNYLKNLYAKLTIEVLAMNLIYFLERKGEWVLCRDILLRIKMKNWHSLVTSKIFFCKSHLMSHMCRYIYITEILTRAGDFHWANEIFQLNTLCLLEPMVEWPYQKVPSDLKLRNDVLQLFFEEGFVVNIVAVNDLLNHINIVNCGKIEGFHIWKLFDEKLCMMLDFEEEYRSILRYLSVYIASYGQYMAKNVLQGYMLFIKDFNEYKQSFELFELCCEKGVYHKYTGNERVIIITTNMCDFEINSILWCFFENILKRRISPHSFRIELKLPDLDQPNKPNILRNRLNRSVFAVRATIINTLKLKYSIIVRDAMEYTIIVTESMQHFLPLV